MSSKQGNTLFKYLFPYYRLHPAPPHPNDPHPNPLNPQPLNDPHHLPRPHPPTGGQAFRSELIDAFRTKYKGTAISNHHPVVSNTAIIHVIQLPRPEVTFLVVVLGFHVATIHPKKNATNTPNINISKRVIFSQDVIEFGIASSFSHINTDAISLVKSCSPSPYSPARNAGTKISCPKRYACRSVMYHSNPYHTSILRWRSSIATNTANHVLRSPSPTPFSRPKFKATSSIVLHSRSGSVITITCHILLFSNSISAAFILFSRFWSITPARS